VKRAGRKEDHVVALARKVTRLFGVALLSFAAFVVGCSSSEDAPLPEDLLEAQSPFVAVPRQDAPDVASVGQALGNPTAFVPGGTHGFYVAVRKDTLKERWFLSAYGKNISTGLYKYNISDFTLGTRVVSFEEQNGKLFVFDVSDQFKISELDDPRILVEAWPVVELPSFSRLRNSDKYVLVDPSAGLNRFAITGEAFADPSLAYGGAYPVRVGLAFMQNFREIEGGATFEEVFTGDIVADGGPWSAWGTLGISLRRYAVGTGFTATPLPETPFYFSSDARFVPNTGGGIEASAVKFNVHPGMAPIQVRITEGAFRAQEDFPEVDVLGAFERGVESWNDAFGFPVFEAKFVHDDIVPDDDVNALLVDYPGGAPFAFADWRHNPNNGETRGMSIYFGGAFFDDFSYFEGDAPPTARPAPEHPPVQTLAWGGLPAHRPACVRWSAELPGHLTGKRGAETERTAQEKSALYIQHIVAHEVGHTLGLRHNFAGSLEPPSSSVMDYLDLFTDALEVATPGPYDRDAIGYLYGTSPELPTSHAFCTDSDLALSASCQKNDSGAEPLSDFWTPAYSFVESLILDSGYPVNLLDVYYLNEVLAFARDPGVLPADRVLALELAFGRSAVPVSAQDAADPYIVFAIDEVADAVLRRIALDPAERRGYMTSGLSAPEALGLVASQAGRMVRNEDGIRSFELRRTAVDVLEALQADAALIELKNAKDVLTTALGDGSVTADEAPLVEDLVFRVRAALEPYYD
jgi:hypothetical protein